MGKRFVDKLVRVNVLNGDEKWIYIHVEVQGTKQAEFAKRIFVYNYRIFDRYDRPVASLAVLADTHKLWKPTSYGFTILGCSHTFKFPVAKLTDYEERLDELLESDNAFGWITAAHILTQKTTKQHQERYEARKGMISQARRKGFPQNIWAVTSDGSPVEAQLENASSGIYHG